jgi:large subunit ribosomal protein L3e
MIGVGLVGYIETPRGLRALTTVWTQHLSEGLRRRFYKNWFRSREKAFTRYAKQNFNEKGERSASLEREIARIGRHCTVVRLLAHTQVHKTGLRLKKAHLLEVQINGGSVADKIAYGLKFFEQEIPVKDVFSMDEMIDTIGVTSGHGFKGCVQRWGVKKLPRKTHRGNRKVACVGSWHPSRIRITQPRAGQMGYHHRTEVNKKVYWVGAPMYDKEGKVVSNAKTDADPSEKTINPLGGWVGYPNIRGEWLMIKGTCPGVRKRPITLRKTLLSQHSSRARENVVVKHVDTAAKYGHGRFQTKTEKNAFFGPTKHNPAA